MKDVTWTTEGLITIKAYVIYEQGPPYPYKTNKKRHRKKWYKKNPDRLIDFWKEGER